MQSDECGSDVIGSIFRKGPSSGSRGRLGIVQVEGVTAEKEENSCCERNALVHLMTALGSSNVGSSFSFFRYHNRMPDRAPTNISGIDVSIIWVVYYYVQYRPKSSHSQLKLIDRMITYEPKVHREARLDIR